MRKACDFLSGQKNVYFVQVDVSSGEDSKVVYLPYTAGVIVANAWRNGRVSSAYAFKEFIFIRKDVEAVVASMENPQVVGFSNYCWNTRYNLALASRIKEVYPDCVTVFGGHNIAQNTDFLQENPQIDYLCFGEGEITFGALLEGLLDGNVGIVSNIAYRDGTQCVMTKQEVLCSSDYASPYLDGWFDGFDKKYEGYEFNSIIETSRGCPNKCAYCDWGLLQSKTRFFPLDKVLAEIEWLGKNKIRFVWGADANFGISENDLTITNAFVSTKEKYGYPERVRINYSKGNVERVREIVRRFNRKGIDRAGATISLQSLSPVVLENIGRKNMSLESFRKNFSMYHEEKLQVYSELILGLPGETYDSFVDGICKLFEIGQHFIFEVYNCIVLPNSALGQPEYMKRHGIVTSRCEIVRYHCTEDAYYIPEMTDIITQTNTMSREMWEKSAVFAGFTQAMHGCGLLRCFAIYAFYELGKSYRSFYEGLIGYIESGKAPFTKKAFDRIKAYFSSLAKGENNRLSVPYAGGLVWENYEYLFLTLCGNHDEFYAEMRPYLLTVISDENILSQLTDYQRAVIRKPDEVQSSCRTEIDFYSYFKGIYINEYSKPVYGSFDTVFVDSDPAAGWEDFGKRVVWYGKMGSRSYKDKISVTAGEVDR